VPRNVTKLSRKRTQSDFEGEFTKSMQNVQELIKSRAEKKLDDEDDVFGKMVAAECKRIKNAKIKRTLKKKINDLIFEAGEEEDELHQIQNDQLLQYVILQPGPQLSEP